MTTSNLHPGQSQPALTINTRRNLWDRLVEPAAAIKDAAARRQARLLSSFLVVIVLSMGNGVYWSWQMDAARGKLYAGAVIVLIMIYALSRTKYHQLAATLFLISLTLLNFAQFTAQSNYSPREIEENIVWIVLVVLLGSTLLSVRRTAVLAVVNIAGAFVTLSILKVSPADIPSVLMYIITVSALILVIMHHRDQLEADRRTELSERNRELQEARRLLEQQVADLDRKTQVLETSLSISQRMSTILDQAQLLDEVVNQVGAVFDYYGIQIYLLDDTREKLTAVAGIGPAEAGKQIRGHSISMTSPVSPVALAARSGQVIKIDNTREAKGWQPNPLWPDTCSEIVTPIVLEGQVIGVFDVQENKVAGLDKDDANFLRFLANQLAIAIRNARLFVKAGTALAEVQVAQERYAQRAWTEFKDKRQEVEYQYYRSGALPLSETLIAEMKQEAKVASRPVTVSLNKAHEQKSAAVVAPIKLQNQVIGAIQIHETEQPRQWSEKELALVQAIADQVAQTADNLRLFEETRQRAGREQTIRQITEHIRSATTLDELVKIAAEELGQRFSVEYSLVELGIESNEEHHAE